MFVKLALTETAALRFIGTSKPLFQDKMTALGETHKYTSMLARVLSKKKLWKLTHTVIYT